MPFVPKEDKNDLLRVAHSAAVRDDLRRLGAVRFAPAPGARGSLEAYMKFLKMSESFANHRRRPPRPITGSSFRL